MLNFSNILIWFFFLSNKTVAVITASIVVLVGICAAIFFFLRKSPQRKPFSVLSKRQVTLDTLNGASIYKWAKEAGNKKGFERVVVYANKKWVHKLGYEYPSQLDPEHNVIAFSVNINTGESANERLFSFLEMSDQVKALFGKEDCFFLKD